MHGIAECGGPHKDASFFPHFPFAQDPDDRPIVHGNMSVIWAWGNTVPAWPVDPNDDMFYAKHTGEGHYESLDFYGGYFQQVCVCVHVR